MTEIPLTEIDDKLGRAYAALQSFRRRDEEGFWAVLGSEDEGEQVAVLMVVLGLVDGWLVEHAGDEWIDRQIANALNRRRDEYPG